MADVGDPVPLHRLGDPGVERLLADVEQAPGLGGDLADAEGVRAVGDEAVERDADVDRDHVAIARPVLGRDPVDDHRVRRDAQGRRKPAVPLRGRRASVRADELLGEAVELDHRDAGPEPLADEGDGAGDEVARAGDAVDLVRRLPDDHARAATCSSVSWISAKTASMLRSAWMPTTLPLDR